ncbi:MAG: N-terminal phage integrase SAM-like domain-containing protein [Actinomycetota bacterium]
MIEAAVLGKDQDLSLGQYLQEWLAHARGRVRVSTYRGYESLIRCYALPALGEVRLSERHERKLWMRDLVMGVAYPPVDR